MSLLAIVILGAVAMLAVVAYLVLRARLAEQEAVYSSRCSACSQKLRYSARKAGSEGICPRCKRRFILPSTPQSLPRPISSYRVGERLVSPRKTA